MSNIGARVFEYIKVSRMSVNLELETSTVYETFDETVDMLVARNSLW
jgi:hypothetical protein